MLRRAITLAVAALAAVAFPTSVALAHDVLPVGPLTVVVGWNEEPAFAGFGNAVSIRVTRGDQPVEDGDLETVVIFGGEDGAERTDPLPLVPAFGDPGHYRAFLIPTRPGQYTFHVTGRVGGQDVDETITSGEDTFDDIQETSTAEFPVRDPSRGELAQRAEQIDERLAAAQADVVDANDAADQAKLFGYVGIALGAIALLVVLLRRPGAKTG
jgi:hypothetical protein